MIMTLGLASTLVSGCGSAGRQPDITFADRAIAAPLDDPLSLVVSIDSDGRLTLNRIETGTIYAPATLNEKLKSIFEDRRRSSIDKNDLVVETVGPVSFDDVDRLVRSLETLGPSRITVITK